MSVSAKSVFTNPYGKMCFDVLRARQGEHTNDPIEKWIMDFENIIQLHSEEICAVLLEPLLQGAGGMIKWPAEAIELICQKAREKNILVIFDEVMTGFGRTGSMFAFEQTKIVPDLLCLSKGLTGGFLPMGLTISTEEIYEAFLDSSTDKMFFHGHSFTGNALSCAAAVANLKIFQNKDIIQNLSQIKKTHELSLEKISKEIPLKETRVCGSVGVLELSTDSCYGNIFSKKLNELTIEQDLFIRPLGNVVYLMPPFCSTSSEVESAWQIIEHSILKIL